MLTIDSEIKADFTKKEIAKFESMCDILSKFVIYNADDRQEKSDTRLKCVIDLIKCLSDIEIIQYNGLYEYKMYYKSKNYWLDILTEKITKRNI